MPYLGTPPQSGFISQEANQYFTGLTQNYIDLNQSISSLSSVIVLVNGVVQENSTMSLTSSTRITLGDTLVSADKVTCIYVAKISSTQAPAVGTVTNDMLSGSIANSKLANSSITLNGSAVSLGGSATVGGDNTPYVVARPNGNQTISSSTWTTVSLGTEILDSDNAFSSNTFTVPSGKAGKYLISYSVRDLATTKAVTIQTTIAIDGTRDNVPLQDWNFDPDYEAKIFTTSNTIIKDLSVGEAVTLQHYALTNGGSPQIREFGTYLSIMRIITWQI